MKTDRTPPAWCERFMGVPFERGRYGPDAADCYGLSWWAAREQLGLEWPRYGDAYLLERHEQLALGQEPSAGWVEVDLDDIGEGDLLVFDQGKVLHVALAVGRGWMLNAIEGRASGCVRWTRPPWAAFLERAVRFEGVPA